MIIKKKHHKWLFIILGIAIIIYLIKFEGSSSEIQNCMNRFNTNQIYEFPNMLSHEECDKIIKLSKDKLKMSTVIGYNKNVISAHRTSKNTFLNNSIDPLMSLINERIQDIIGINPENYEELQVVHYQIGQEYKEHWDAIGPKDPGYIEDFKKGGLRFATFLLYLNDDMEGGETNFPLMGKKIKPQKGKGVLFFNLNDDLNDRKKISKHAGLPPTKGEKWMCNKWIRLNKIP